MTRPLVAIERFFERLFERPATRLFNPRLQPVQLQRRLERAMESERRISHDRTYVPDRYRIALNPRDFGHFEGYRSTLESDLSEALLKRARQRGYTLLARTYRRGARGRHHRAGRCPRPGRADGGCLRTPPGRRGWSAPASLA